MAASFVSSVRGYSMKVLVLVFGVLNLIAFATALPSAASRSGPFESSMVRAAECGKPTLPIDKNPPIIFHAEMYNTSTKTNQLRGDVTILRDCKNKKIKAKGFYWEHGKWKLVYLINNMGCNSVFMPVVTVATGVKYDQKNCIFFKGKYIFEGVDTNRLQHLLSSKQEYGRIMWRNEFHTHAGTAFCWEFETLVVPLRQNT